MVKGFLKNEIYKIVVRSILRTKNLICNLLEAFQKLYSLPLSIAASEGSGTGKLAVAMIRPPVFQRLPGSPEFLPKVTPGSGGRVPNPFRRYYPSEEKRI